MPTIYRRSAIVCLVALLWVPRRRLFTSLRTSPPANVAPLTPQQVKDGAYAEFVESWITRKRHNQLMWLPSSSSTLGPLSPLGGLVSLMIVVGDSYADDIDMGFQCWPTQLSKALHAPVLNVARGGSESSHIHSQLERAHLWTKEQQLQVNLSEVLLVLHTGGNDALHSLLKPWMFVSLISDLYSLRSEAVEKKSVELSFPKKLSIVILRDVDEFLERAAALGHRKVVISTLPIVSSLPLARLLVHVLVPGADPGFVTETLEAVGGSINRHLQEQCVVLAQKHGVEAWIFQEGDSLDSLAKGAEAATHGVFSAVKLALKRIRRIIWALASQESLDGHEFWHDGHHPAARAHEQLAAEVLELLTTAPISSQTIACSFDKLFRPPLFLAQMGKTYWNGMFLSAGRCHPTIVFQLLQ